MIKSVKIGNVPFLRYYQDFMILQDIEFDKRDAYVELQTFVTGRFTLLRHNPFASIMLAIDDLMRQLHHCGIHSGSPL